MNTIMIDPKIETFTKSLVAPTYPTQLKNWDLLKEATFPTTKDEYWKYTRLGKISQGSFVNRKESNEKVDVSAHLIAKDYLVIVNGVFRDDLSKYDESGYEINIQTGDSLEISGNVDVFGLVNNSTINQKVLITLEKNKVAKEPLQIVVLGAGENVLQSIQIETKIDVSAEGRIILSYVSDKSKNTFTNVYTHSSVGENAKLTIDKFQLENENTFHVSTDEAVQESSSNFSINTNVLDGRLVRNNLNITVTGQNCETNLNGIVLGHGENHVDNHTFVSHDVSNCVSNENYKYVMDDRSTGVFNGRVIVQKDAQQINAYQNNGNVLLSEKAAINAKPELEIYADDVKCSHGSTTGQLDEDALFYLQTRGISLKKAKKILVSAFIAEVVEDYENEAVRDYLFEQLRQRFGWEF